MRRTSENALARFLQVEGVSDAERDLAFANIKAAADYYGVNVRKIDWRELEHPGLSDLNL
jgi:hypothetical protein